ncbi:MAG: 4Fe-4S dicluster domain-containing protein [Defluviitaleaceae bacterium]|nr:4Fe-4S dicluster domain-containing protein [Defluviitaleaceae bacterium]
MLKLPVSKMDELFSLINSERTLYMPLEKNSEICFDKWSSDASIRLDKLNTVKSPKDFFFPASENIAAFKTKGKEIIMDDIRSEIEPFALFGVRACDAESFNLLDLIFLNDKDFVDTFYESRRQNGIIITTACNEPEETCFCNVFNIDAANPGGDISTWIIDDTLYWNSLTKKGSGLTEKIKKMFEQADESEIADHQAKISGVINKLPFKDLSLDGFTGEALIEKFSSNQWEEICHTCLSCGTCTFICPTCHCYDIQDFDTGKEIHRIKCWDSCMYYDFTLMAHGNPRTSLLERFRQRYMHKLVYFPENNDGAYACVGCGRCVQKCPISMNIVKVAKALKYEGMK